MKPTEVQQFDRYTNAILDTLIAELEGMKGNVPLEGNQALALNYNLALQDAITLIKSYRK